MPNRRRILLALTLALVAIVAVVVIDLLRVYTDDPIAPDPYRAMMLEQCAERQPAGENGWPQLAAVLEEVDRIAWAARSELPRSASWEEGDSAAHAALDGAFETTDLLDRLRAALSKQRHVRPWATEGFMLGELLPLLNPARDVAESLRLRAETHVAAGAWDDAMDLLDLILRLGDVTARQPTAVQGGSGARIQGIAIEAVRTWLDREAVPPAAAERIATLMESLDEPPVAYHVEMERLGTRNLLHWTHGARGRVLPLETLLDFEVVGGGLIAAAPIDPVNDDRSLVLALISRWYLVPHDECADLVDRWYAALAERIDRPYAGRWDDWPPPALDAIRESGPFAVAGTFIPALSSLIDRREEFRAARDAARLMAVIEQYQAHHGRAPDSLEDLVPEWIDVVPIDPLSGGPWNYRIDPERGTGLVEPAEGLRPAPIGMP